MAEEESHETSYSTSIESAGEERREEEPAPPTDKKPKTLAFWRKATKRIKQFSLLYFVFFSISGLLIGAMYLIKTLKIDTEITLYTGSTEDEIVTPHLSSVIGVFGMLLFGFSLLDCVIYYTSGYLLDKVDVLTLVLFYVNSVSSLISASVFTLGTLVYLRVKEVLYKLHPAHEIGLDQMLSVCLVALLVITMKNVWVRRVKIGFNHTNYLLRIQRCLVENQFVKILDMVRRKIKQQKGGKRKTYWMFSNPAHERQSEEETPETTPHNEPNDQDAENESYIKPKEIDLSDAANIGIKQKMIVFKEFEKIMNRRLYHMEKGLRFSTDTKQDIQKKAEKIAQWLGSDGKSFQVKDLKKYVDRDYVDKVSEFLGLSQNQVLNQKEIASMIEKTRREKYAVRKSLVQMDKALIKVSQFITMSILLFAVGNLLSLLINDTVLKTAVGALVGIGFIFQPSVKNAIDSLIFLFIVHPYDIGDRIRVEVEKEELNMVVSELNVFSTVFYQWDGAKIYIPNHVLLQKTIINVRRSGLMAENIVFQIAFETPPEKIQQLKTEVAKFIKKHPKEYAGYFMFNYHEIENTNKLHLKIYLQHAMNWQNYEAYLQRKAKFVMFLKQAITEQKIEYYLPVQRVEILSDRAQVRRAQQSVENGSVDAPAAAA